MSLLGKIASVVTDPGEIVKDAVNALLPKQLAVVGDIAGAAVDAARGNPLAINHALEAIRDLPQAASAISHGLQHTPGESTRTISGHSAGRCGTPGFEPTPPPRGPQVSVSINGGQVMVTINTPTHGPGGWHGPPTGLHPWHGPQAIEAGWQGPWHGSASPGLSAPAVVPNAAAPGTGAISSVSQIDNLSDTAFMNAVRDGKISPDVAKDPAAMLKIQERMNRITQMNQLMSQMLAAMHQMAMSTIQNIRA